MPTLDPEMVDALNMLLEDVRASVEIEVALSNGATEYLEREALTAMGVEDTLFAFELRDWLDAQNLPVTRRINGIVLQALDLTRYDDRLSLFLHHQLASRDQAEQLLEEDDLDNAGQEMLRAIVDAHTRHAAWSEERAREFAASRQLDFRRPNERPPGAPDAPETPDGSEGSDAPDPPEASGARSSPRAPAAMAQPDALDEPDAPGDEYDDEVDIDDIEDIEDVEDVEDVEDAITSPNDSPPAEAD
ncbi:MAG TPA: hypothetical protein VFQ32_03220 [Ktedonobacterales bacterium]|nr:hypothetical protein [Ktedonobacterales bacterium]